MSGWYWYSDNPNCGRCGHLNSQGYCDMTACIYPVLPQTQTIVMTEHRLTNGMKRRLMTDEEFALWLSDLAEWLPQYAGKSHAILKWLKQEATE